MQRLPHVRCDIYDERGKAVEPLLSIVHPRYAEALPNPRSVERMLWLAGLLLFAAFPLFWLDYQHHGHWMWPTFLGINLIFASIRYLLWAFGIRDRLRARSPAAGQGKPSA